VEIDALVLTWEERRWTRGRRRTRGGREVQLALPTGTVLAPGDVVAEGPGFRVVVEAAAEPVLAALPRDRDEAIRVAYEVGNRHGVLARAGEALLVPDEKAMALLLERLKVPFERRSCAFDPIGRGHGQGDEHGHGHGHVHE
jgi:urease accessory protein